MRARGSHGDHAAPYYGLGVEETDGEPVSDQDIENWADEAKRSHDLERLRKRDRSPLGDGPGTVVPVQLDDTLLAALTERADRERLSRSEAIQAAIRAYVA